MRQWARDGRQYLARYVRPLWRSLALFGSLYCDPRVLKELSPPPPPPAWPGPGLLAWSAPAGGPPPAHPERLCEHVPLSEAERRYAAEVWPPYGSGQRPGP
ncbi:DUF6059 family protein [Streptomyces sp. NPDC057877]|uniref:DUF6059 family protein n=1 Tax=Streptomyces sp. NPDC057877 TaxID=3346269 RepID=UPI00369DAFC8